jgi:hypothetical protein
MRDICVLFFVVFAAASVLRPNDLVFELQASILFLYPEASFLFQTGPEQAL